AAAVEKERAAFRQVAGEARRVRQVPAVHDLAAEIDEVDGLASDKMRRKQRKPRKGPLRIACAQAGAPALERVLLDGSHVLVTPEDLPRSFPRKRESRDDLGPRFRGDERMMSD